MIQDFKFKSVLNTDGYDRRTYEEIRQASKRLRETEESGSQELPTFPHLLGDIWASLFKNLPELLEEVPRGVEPNQALMREVMANPEFHALREYSRLDKMASALGAIQLGANLQQEITKNEDLSQTLQNAAQATQEAEQKQAEAEALQSAADLLEDGPKKEKLSQRAQSLLEKAQQALQKAGQLNQQAAEAMQATFGGEGGQKQLAALIKVAGQETREEVEQVNAFMSGLGYGHEAASPSKVPVNQSLALADMLKSNGRLRKIAQLAGRMKAIAAKKQKTKTRDTIERTDVETGNDPARILPSELLMMQRPETRLDFKRRFVEGQVLQYGPGGKQRLGKGPIVICTDTSGSMKELDTEAKALMLALLAIARKQRRAFAVINFSTECTSWTFPDPRKATPANVIEMAEFFYNGGTNFVKPLSAAMKIIEASRFNKADIVFITDGEATVPQQWLEKFLKLKKKKQTQVLSIQLGNSHYRTLEQFSDQVFQAATLFDNLVTNAVLAI